MIKVAVGSKNPVKIAAIKTSFEKYFGHVNVTGFDAPSGVHDQPTGNDTFIGAENRVKYLMHELSAGYDYYASVEGGIHFLYDRWFAFGAVCIGDPSGNIGFGTSPNFELPRSISDELLLGKELGQVIDELEGNKNTKHKGGAIGHLTGGILNRQELYESGVLCALIRFNHKLFK